jgi:hypothetical protein
MDALEAWLCATSAPAEPVRADVHLRIAFARREHHVALATQLAAHERACGDLLARYPRPHAAGRHTAGPTLVDDAVVTRLRAELAWLVQARTALERDAD